MPYDAGRSSECGNPALPAGVGGWRERPELLLCEPGLEADSEEASQGDLGATRCKWDGPLHVSRELRVVFHKRVCG